MFNDISNLGCWCSGLEYLLLCWQSGISHASACYLSSADK